MDKPEQRFKIGQVVVHLGEPVTDRGRGTHFTIIEFREGFWNDEDSPNGRAETFWGYTIEEIGTYSMNTGAKPEWLAPLPDEETDLVTMGELMDMYMDRGTV